MSTAVTVHLIPLLLERGHLDQAEALLERHPDPLEPRAVSCDVGWLWAQRLEVAARRGDLPAARVALDGYRSAAPWRGWRWKHSHLGLHGPIAAMRVGLPPAEVRPLGDTIDRDALVLDEGFADFLTLRAYPLLG